jgi:hypothetical protein
MGYKKDKIKALNKLIAREIDDYRKRNKMQKLVQ